jgi:hypothetical protein
VIDHTLPDTQRIDLFAGNQGLKLLNDKGDQAGVDSGPSCPLYRFKMTPVSGSCPLRMKAGLDVHVGSDL